MQLEEHLVAHLARERLIGGVAFDLMIDRLVVQVEPLIQEGLTHEVVSGVPEVFSRRRPPHRSGDSADPCARSRAVPPAACAPPSDLKTPVALVPGLLSRAETESSSPARGDHTCPGMAAPPRNGFSTVLFSVEQRHTPRARNAYECCPACGGPRSWFCERQARRHANHPTLANGHRTLVPV